MVYSACTPPAIYLLEANNTCYSGKILFYALVCPWNPPTQYYASPFNNTCQTQCPTGWYGFDGDKKCTQTCPSSPNMTFYDDTNSKCVTSCPTGSFSYLGAIVASNQRCVSSIFYHYYSLSKWYIRLRDKPPMCSDMPNEYILQEWFRSVLCRTLSGRLLRQSNR